MNGFAKIVCVLSVTGACGSYDGAANEASEPAVERPGRVDVRQDAGFVAVVAPRRQASVAPEIAARIERVHVRMGDQIREGEAILTLDAKSVRDELASARATAQAARAAIQAASLELESARRLHLQERDLNKEGVSSMATVRRAQIDMKKAQASRAQRAAEGRRTEAEVERLERILKDTTLRAPMDGTVSLLRAREGDLVSAGQVVVRIFVPGDWQLRFAVPSDTAPKVAKGGKVQFSVDGARDARLTATIQDVAAELEPPLQLVVVEAHFEDTSDDRGWLRAGRVGRVFLPKSEETAKGGS